MLNPRRAAPRHLTLKHKEGVGGVRQGSCIINSEATRSLLLTEYQRCFLGQVWINAGVFQPNWDWTLDKEKVKGQAVTSPDGDLDCQGSD